MKTADLKSLSDIELSDKLVEESNIYSKTKLTHSVSPLENPSTLKTMRRLIARLKTEVRRRELDSLIK
jgi:large subunit ribosomal protein L29